MTAKDLIDKLDRILANNPADDFVDTFKMYLTGNSIPPTLILILNFALAGWNIEYINERMEEIFGETLPLQIK